jgi:TonB family protein
VSGMSASQRMNEARTSSRRYQLRSELALDALRGEGSSRDRGLIWVNAVCAVVLLLGILGLKKPRAIQARKPQVNQEVLTLPVVFRPPETDPLQQAADSQAAPPLEAVNEWVEEVVLPTLVAPEAADVVFPVPVEGPTIVASRAALAEPPPVRSTPVPVPPSETSGPQVFRTGQGVADGGFYPDPEYPREASIRQEQGRTQILIEVSEAGRVVRAEVRISSGSTLLDRHTVAHVRRFWRFPAGPRREYLWTAEYVLR